MSWLGWFSLFVICGIVGQLTYALLDDLSTWLSDRKEKR